MTQPALFPDLIGLPATVLHGEGVTVMLPSDGRAVLWVKTRRGPAWLELLPDARQWLADKLRTGAEPGEAGEP